MPSQKVPMTIGMISSLQGIQRAETQFNQAAQNIARVPSSQVSSPEGDIVDLSAQATFLERHLRHSDSEKRSKVIYHALSGD